MTLLRRYIQFALILLISSAIFGVLAALAFLYPETFNRFLPFYQLRPMHVSSALFWIVSAATACIMHFKREVFPNVKRRSAAENVFMITWMLSIAAVFVSYAIRQFGGREYWEFPPVLCLPLLLSWLILCGSYFATVFRSKAPKPVYVYMWTTGIFFFLLTFIEQNLWLLPWFRSSFVKEVTVQWKSNGSMVGAWNQMIYGTMTYVMMKISGKKEIAENWKTYFFYFLGLANLMFNWGHHTYNVPNGSWIRNVSYIISMTELIFLINMIIVFSRATDEKNKTKYRISYRFFKAAEFWAFANLALALAMSVPAINRYTHGTHVTVAHAMIATIGINTMILLGTLGYLLRADEQTGNMKGVINGAYWLCQVSLLCFGILLVTAGIIKGYQSVALNITDFNEVMKPVIAVLKIFAVVGAGLAAGLVTIAICYLKMVSGNKTAAPVAIKNNVEQTESYLTI